MHTWENNKLVKAVLPTIPSYNGVLQSKHEKGDVRDASSAGLDFHGFS